MKTLKNTILVCLGKDSKKILKAILGNNRKGSWYRLQLPHPDVPNSLLSISLLSEIYSK